MPQVSIEHSTEYLYDRPVRLLTHRLMLRPRDSFDLAVKGSLLTVSPPVARTRWAHDVFGNSICYLEWDEVRTRHLKITSTLDLKHYPGTSDLPLDPGAGFYPFAYAAAELPDLAPFLQRHHPDPDGVIANWALSFLDPSGSQTMAVLTSMTQTIKAGFTYETRDTEGTNAPAHTLATRSGACRDFALLMMEAVRSLGLAARFVSGYLYDETLSTAPGDTPTLMVGGGATHAWVSVYLPGAGWVEFDPTNGLIAGRNLIRVCSARTPGQAVPVSGAYDGQPGDFQTMRVSVGVTVAPLPRGRAPTLV
jgi:transglutaminase-like putative cysteine protease